MWLIQYDITIVLMPLYKDNNYKQLIAITMYNVCLNLSCNIIILYIMLSGLVTILDIENIINAIVIYNCHVHVNINV